MKKQKMATSIAIEKRKKRRKTKDKNEINESRNQFKLSRTCQCGHRWCSSLSYEIGQWVPDRAGFINLPEENTKDSEKGERARYAREAIIRHLGSHAQMLTAKTNENRPKRIYFNKVSFVLND